LQGVRASAFHDMNHTPVMKTTVAMIETSHKVPTVLRAG
jgi:hypothetical protein